MLLRKFRFYRVIISLAEAIANQQQLDLT